MSASIINESGDIYRKHSRSVIDGKKPTAGMINALPLVFQHVARDERKKKEYKL